MAFITNWNVTVSLRFFSSSSERSNREMAPLEITDQVKRWASLGRETFEEKIGECIWEVALQIPYKVFFKHTITKLDGMVVRANFYKCGDELQKLISIMESYKNREAGFFIVRISLDFWNSNEIRN